jgi:hypothetical protein
VSDSMKDKRGRSFTKGTFWIEQQRVNAEVTVSLLCDPGHRVPGHSSGIFRMGICRVVLCCIVDLYVGHSDSISCY